MTSITTCFLKRKKKEKKEKMNGKGRNFSLVYLLICQTKTGEEKCFRGEGCVEAFLDYLLEFKHNSTVIAHNFKGYDGFPVLKVLLDHLLVPDVIYAGGKLLSVTLRKEKIRFVDSLNFLVMPLSSFPKAFDLRLDEASERLSKGFFPFLFNTAANEGYVGPLPPRETFLPSGFGVKKLAAFEVWYTRMAADPDYVFDLQAKMEAYCSMDVTILRMGCQAFSKEFEQVMQVGPLQTCHHHVIGLQRGVPSLLHATPHAPPRAHRRLHPVCQAVAHGLGVVGAGGSPPRTALAAHGQFGRKTFGWRPRSCGRV